jgi:outer membrane protein assembly factor BamB
MTYREGEPAPVIIAAFGGRVLGLDPGTGEVRWEQLIETTGYACSLLVTNSTIYTCGVKKLVCLDYPTGAVRWTADMPRGRGTLLLEGGRLFVATSSGEIDCFSLDGQRLWHNPLKGKGNGAVALGTPGNVMQADDRG